MRTFKDRSGRDWTLDVTSFTLDAVEGKFGLWLPALFDDTMKPLAELMGDERKFVAVVYELCREAAEKASLTLDDLKRTWHGEHADAAEQAFVEDLIGFFRQPERREALRGMVAKLKEIGEKTLAKGMLGLGAVDADQAAELLIAHLRASASLPAGSSTSAPACSASTPAPSPSADSS